jgi:LDH2 family malate/lactate/ureidoglycolate dehydrogenase
MNSPQQAVRPPVTVDAARLRAYVASMFRAAGMSQGASDIMGDALVDADLTGRASHGVLQSEAYLPRLKNGSITTAEKGDVVLDREAVAVLNAKHMLGHLAGDQGMAIAIEKAKKFGIGAVAVRHGAHFGAASRYVLSAAHAGCIGIAMCNSRPVMPAPGGASPMVGTNPLAIAMPTAREPALVLDMATTEGTVGRLRVAAKAGKQIPPTWAVDVNGVPTTDPDEALKGMLLPAGGAKGFGLALMIDLFSGLLSSGAWGDHIPPMRDLSRSPSTSYFFVALDIEHFRPLAGFLTEAQAAAERVRGSKPAPGGDRVTTPGERSWNQRIRNGETVKLEAATLDVLARLAADFGVKTPDLSPSK